MNIQIAIFMLVLVGYTFMFLFGYWCALYDTKRSNRSLKNRFYTLRKERG